MIQKNSLFFKKKSFVYLADSHAISRSGIRSLRLIAHRINGQNQIISI